MGLLPTVENWAAEVEEFRRTVVACAALHRRKDDEGLPKNPLPMDLADGDEGSMVCVTSGVSYLGMAIANQLLLHGYSVRITVHNSGMIFLLTLVRFSVVIFQHHNFLTFKLLFSSFVMFTY